MSEFCENCPMRGKATNELEDVQDYTLHRQIAGTPFGNHYTDPKTVGALIDDKGDPSQPIYYDFNKSRLLKRIGACEAPETREKKRFFKEPKRFIHCPAIGNLAVRDSELYDYVAERTMLH